jgi:hypothetical protein
MTEFLDNSELEEMRILEQEFRAADGTMSDKLDAAYSKYQGCPFMDEHTFWRHMAYIVAEITTTTARAMKSEHENMLAYRFELEKRSKEFGFENKSHMDIKQQWEDHKKSVHAKLDELRMQREGTT